MSHLKENLDLALELSREIVRLAEEKAWSEMEQLDRQRMQVLESVFSDAGLKVSNREVTASIQAVKELNDKAMEICADARVVVVADSKKIRLGREATAAYYKYDKSHFTNG
ncbi:MAG: hypothetical protein KZQ78_08995 [Candidatus Thiodiazotropha sp. (ex Ustalcina ferruginea)]|nr:hypothetical protein [Candidatus Thiodiazotropha sp. (ex Ustalcina ferruginea)]